MSISTNNINYAFRANSEIYDNYVPHHLRALELEHFYMFRNIDVEALKIDAEAINILTASCETVALAIEANKQGKPFFLSIGENHKDPGHYIHHLLVIKGLKNADINFKVSCENRETGIIHTYFRLLEDVLGDNFDKEKAYEHFNDSDLNLRMLFMQNFGVAHYANKVLNHHLITINKDIAVNLTDAPRLLDGGKESDYINVVHPGLTTTLKYMGLYNPIEKALRSKKIPLIPFYNNAGMAVRNVHSVMQALKTQTNVVHIAGRAHVDNDLMPEVKNRNVLSVYAHDLGFNPIDRVLLNLNFDKVSMQLFPDIKFANEVFLRPAPPFTNHIVKFEDESEDIEYEDDKDYIHTHMKSLGLESLCFMRKEMKIAKMLMGITQNNPRFEDLAIMEKACSRSIVKDITDIALKLNPNLYEQMDMNEFLSSFSEPS